MIMTTTSTIEGYPVRQYLGIVTGEVIMGANVFRDFLASITDVVGGRSGAYEGKLQEARETALEEMRQQASRLGATGIIGIDIDYEVVREGMLMVSVSGTAVLV
ncbi:UPF0145 protein [Paenibacillus macerans]|uniref:UPF0145 protein DJ90_1781 n=1 Tax=Paenibacillus macerans TaxID=44252 RepID=A0A090ZCM8_PAEMA|nr:YbjQ family protein [Paenibacillus macerans]KFN08153.1 heavy-metal-binding family protein [Paenibacillus macerans]MBS5913896.1 YbjQ family protein [Paenibacillus macerans]MCM3697973.1 YbjQ family protein [Paenibacillus macerans]MCY7561906.1 YbjQ family protein [Paenibacillus macerans]MDU7474062.1 YbjQ family protein [Paenibacillus macerans]